MNLLQAVILGVVEGLTEFLPVSSTGHLTITEKLLGLQVNDPAITAFTAVIQVGAIVAVLVYFARDIVAIVGGLCRGLVSAPARSRFEFRYGVLVIVGSIPIGIVGLAGRHLIEGPLRSLWVVACALILWSAVMIYAERSAAKRRSAAAREAMAETVVINRAELNDALARGTMPAAGPAPGGAQGGIRRRSGPGSSVAVSGRGESDLTMADALVIGLTQCLALIPGVSRSGATISAGLLRGLDRVSATRLSFFLGIPALVAAGALELKDALKGGVGLLPTLVGTVVSFVVAYAAVAWLLRFVANHKITAFVWYRVLVGVLVIVALSARWLAAT